MSDEIAQAPKEEYSYSKAIISNTGLEAGPASKSDAYGNFATLHVSNYRAILFDQRS